MTTSLDHIFPVASATPASSRSVCIANLTKSQIDVGSAATELAADVAVAEPGINHRDDAAPIERTDLAPSIETRARCCSAECIPHRRFPSFGSLGGASKNEAIERTSERRSKNY